MDFLWLPRFKIHCSGHHPESPEIDPDFIEKVLEFGRPSRVYADKSYPHRQIFEGYYPSPPANGRPYRVIFELTDQGEVVPVSCWRIKDRDFRKNR